MDREGLIAWEIDSAKKSPRAFSSCGSVVLDEARNTARYEPRANESTEAIRTFQLLVNSPLSPLIGTESRRSVQCYHDGFVDSVRDGLAKRASRKVTLWPEAFLALGRFIDPAADADELPQGSCRELVRQPKINLNSAVQRHIRQLCRTGWLVRDFQSALTASFCKSAQSKGTHDFPVPRDCSGAAAPDQTLPTYKRQANVSDRRDVQLCCTTSARGPTLFSILYYCVLVHREELLLAVLLYVFHLAAASNMGLSARRCPIEQYRTDEQLRPSPPRR